MGLVGMAGAELGSRGNSGHWFGAHLGPAIRQLTADHDLGTPSHFGRGRCAAPPDATSWLRDVGRVGQQFDVVVEPDAGGDRIDRMQDIGGRAGQCGRVGLGPAGDVADRAGVDVEAEQVWPART
jgi:hypothetical protein